MSAINQKEYLKKYLSTGGELSKKKKRKKKGTAISDRVKIIDDDIDVDIFNKAVEDDLHGEDAPQIVGIIDERPLELRIDDYRKSDLWTPVGTQNAAASEGARINEAVSKNNDSNPRRRQKLKNINSYEIIEGKRGSSSDRSPPRRSQSHRKSDFSPPRRNVVTADNSPPRRRANDTTDIDFSPPRRHSRSETHSPPRRHSKSGTQSPYDKYKKFDFEISSDGTSKFDRKRTHSPSRSKRDDESSSSRRRRRDGDSSPTRIRDTDSNSSGRRRKGDHDLSTLRSNKYQNRQNHEVSYYSKDHMRSYERRRRRLSEDRTQRHDADLSTPRKDRKGGSEANHQRKTAKDFESTSKTNLENTKATRTLDGKAAGLQNADELARETEVWKKREDELFKNMSADVSGRNATAIVRDRRTGRIRDFKKEAEEESKRKEKEAENQEKYARWGKGLKQVEEHNEKVSNELYEMSKPLARYADDEDLERYLKEQEREGDPMLDYIRKKKKRKHETEQKPIKPQYEGEFMPNRYGIRPGYRWDGVDRSSGYEKKWFEVLNSRRAAQEEVYKWSTEDM